MNVAGAGKKHRDWHSQFYNLGSGYTRILSCSHVLEMWSGLLIVIKDTAVDDTGRRCLALPDVLDARATAYQHSS